MQPRVLMIIPTLGQRLDLFEETLMSLADQNSRTNKVLDIVVVCPKKSKEARELATKFGAIIADDPSNPRGISAAVNAGIALAKPWHEYAAWMGDDDLLRPDSILSTLTVLDADKEAVVAFGHCDYIDDKGQHLFTSRAGRLAPWIMTWGPDLVPLPGALFRLSAVNEVGLFDTTLRYAMDLDMFLRLRKKGRFINVNKTVGAFRWHPTSTTVADRTSSLNEAEQVKRRYLSKTMRVMAPLWEKPVRLATRLAAYRVNALARN